MLTLFKFINFYYLRSRPLKMLLTLLGMTAGIAVFAAIQIANQSVLFSLQDTLHQLRGTSDFSISGNERPATNDDFLKIKSLPRLKQASPVFELVAQCGDSNPQSLTLLGIDPLSRGDFFPPEAQNQFRAEQFLKLLSEPSWALIPQSVAETCGFKENSDYLFSVRGKGLKFRGEFYPDAKQASSIVFMDIATAQESLGPLHELSRIDIRLDGISTEDWIRQYQSQIPLGLQIVTPQAQLEQGRQLLKAFQHNLLSLGLVSIFVSVFIVYNTASLSLLYRRPQLALLRGLGATKQQIAVLFSSEILLLGLLASGFGILLGWGLAQFIFKQVLQTIHLHYLSQLVAQLKLQPFSVVVSLGIGILASGLGAAIPLSELFSISPAEAARKLSFEKHLRHHPYFLIGVALVSSAVAVLTAKLSSLENPEWSFLSALAALLACLSLTPFIMLVLLRALAWLAHKLRFGVLKIGVTQITENPYRYSVITAALSMAMALWLGISLMVSSFRLSVEDWVRANIRGDLYVTLSDNPKNGFQSFLPPELIEKIAGLPDLARLDVLRSFKLKYRNEDFSISAIRLKDLIQTGGFQILEGKRQFWEEPRDSSREIPSAISESFAKRQGLKVGQSFQAQTPWGSWNFFVATILYDYSSERGLIYIEHDDFVRHSHDPRLNSLAIYLKDPFQGPMIKAQVNNLGPLPPTLKVELNREVTGRVFQIFDSTFQVTEALKTISLFVAFLGILTTLALLVEEKRREIGLLQAIGMTPWQTKVYGLSQGFSLSFVGASLGTLTGLILSWIILKVIHPSFFGWTIFFHWNGILILRSFGLTLLTGTLASTWAMITLNRMKPAEALRFEE